MLRHLLTSTARTSSRLSFAKSSTVVLAARPPHVRSPWWKDMLMAPSFWFFAGSFGFMFAIKRPMDEATLEGYRSHYSENSCYMTKLVSPTSEPVDAATQSIKKPDLFEDGRIMFAFENPTFLDDSTGVEIGAAVQISNISFTSDYNEICDGLGRRGIHVERSEEGARKGLGEYAVRQLHENLAKYSAKKDDSRFSQTAFDDSRLESYAVQQTRQSKRMLNGMVICMVAQLIHPYGVFTPAGFFFGSIASAFYFRKRKTFYAMQQRPGTYHCNKMILPSEAVDAATQSIKNRDPLENATFELRCKHPTFLVNDTRTDLFAEVKTSIKLPPGTEMKEIHDGLERRGIHVDNSKEGVRRGLTEYAIKLMNEGVDEYFQKAEKKEAPKQSTLMITNFSL